MFVIEVNGVRVEAETEKDARKALARAAREERKAQEARNAAYALAKMRGEAAGYRLLARKAAGEEMPRAWRFYAPDHVWTRHMARPVANGGFSDPHITDHELQLETPGGWVRWNHYGYDLVGAVCNGGGYCWVVFLRDRNRPDEAPACYAVGAEGEQVALADCPGITIADFAPEANAPEEAPAVSA